MQSSITELGREELLGLLQDASLNWLAHDGLWFQAVEEKFGTTEASLCNQKAIAIYSEIEAKRIKRRFHLTQGGIPDLMQALKFRMYHLINEQDFVEVSGNRCIFRMVGCRVQQTRKQKGLPDYPCKAVGIKEYSHFAKTIDPRIQTRCVACPPDMHPDQYWCAWEFFMDA
ncbi:DUF6125 family protein [Desulfatirhabdium butyrativorans]|uniref:DUF6125 family protein n=1 Tax=Desulfatirhabdium butyrativorans TaxID=340467 RepID=UPI0003FEFB47|nr:DUF6125 family protein [Desulfatirhabdium butyrativorans]